MIWETSRVISVNHCNLTLVLYSYHFTCRKLQTGSQKLVLINFTIIERLPNHYKSLLPMTVKGTFDTFWLAHNETGQGILMLLKISLFDFKNTA